VWLDPGRTSPYEFFQFWLRTGDAEAGSYLRRFTFLPRDRIEELDEATATRPEQRAAARQLAFEVTALVHGPEEAGRAEQAGAVLFTPEIAALDPAILEMALADAPTVEVAREAVEGQVTVLDALILCGLAESRGQGRKLLAQGSVYINGHRVPEDRPLEPADVLHGRWIVLRRGRSKQCVLMVGA
jgi:tyrosyl-tRNA synthetase